VKPRIELRARRKPRQARSVAMNALILEAATRVLRRQGAAAFTTNRVAETAGISVGSLYQYYPNKAALLFRLQEAEMQETWRSIETILDDRSLAPRERLLRGVQRFFAAEAEELELNRSLQLAQVFYRETPEFRAQEARIVRRLEGFLAEALRGRRPADLAFEARLLAAVVAGAAERATREALAPADVRRWASAVGGMLCERFGL
jgi:AcrR family transcriptional regulator